MKKVRISRYFSILVLVGVVLFLVFNINLRTTGNIIETSTSGNVITTSYIYGNGLVASVDSNGEEKYYINDHLGGTSIVLDENGNKISEESYYAFGEEKSSGGERFTYTGKEKDDSGLYYYGARYYDSDSGRFTTPDPISGSMGNPQSLNKYVYVLNNPNKFVDPSGMIPRSNDNDRMIYSSEAAADNTNVVNYQRDWKPQWMKGSNGGGVTVTMQSQESADAEAQMNRHQALSMAAWELHAISEGMLFGAMGGSLGARNSQLNLEVDRDVFEAYREKIGREITDETLVYAFRADKTMKIGRFSERDKTRWYSLEGPNIGYLRKNLVETTWGELKKTAEIIEYDPSSAPGKIVNIQVLHKSGQTPKYISVKQFPYEVENVPNP